MPFPIQLIESSKRPQETGTLMTPIFQKGKLRNREVKGFTPDTQVGSNRAAAPWASTLCWGAGARPILHGRKQAPAATGDGMGWGGGWVTLFCGEKGPGHQRNSSWGPSSLPNVYTNTHSGPALESVSHAGRDGGREVESARERETWQRGTPGCTATASQRKSSHGHFHST